MRIRASEVLPSDFWECFAVLNMTTVRLVELKTRLSKSSRAARQTPSRVLEEPLAFPLDVLTQAEHAAGNSRGSMVLPLAFCPVLLVLR